MADTNQNAIGNHLALESGWEDNARIRQKLAGILGIVGEESAANHMLGLARQDLDEAKKQGEEALEKAIAGELDHDRHLPPAAVVNKVHSIQGQVQTVVKLLFDTAHRSVPHHEFAYRELERIYEELQAQLSHAVEQQRQALVILDSLERFLKRIESLAENYESLQAVWLQQVDVLATMLK